MKISFQNGNDDRTMKIEECGEIGRKFIEVNECFTQMLSGHGYFRIYLYRYILIVFTRKVKYLMMQSTMFSSVHAGRAIALY